MEINVHSDKIKQKMIGFNLYPEDTAFTVEEPSFICLSMCPPGHRSYLEEQGDPLTLKIAIGHKEAVAQIFDIQFLSVFICSFSSYPGIMAVKVFCLFNLV